MNPFDFSTLSKNSKFILACSYGPDSMALFNMMLEADLDFIVCHVNYHKRKESDFEEKSLREFCALHNKEIIVLDLKDHVYTKNFQAEARELRYEFFAKTAIKYNAAAVLTAHHLDDLLETYFMQKDRGVILYYGIRPVTVINGITIIRPLLNYEKRELEEYDIEHKVPYSVDISNLSDDYTRNQIRHNIIEKLSREDKLEYVEYINKLNRENALAGLKITGLIKNGKVDKEIAKQLNEKEFLIMLHELVLFSTKKVYSISSKTAKEIRKALDSNKANISIKLDYEYNLDIEYGVISVNQSSYTYRYELERPMEFEANEFSLNFRGDTSDRNIYPKDYPIQIHNSVPNMKYEINGYMVSLRRLYIDWKMPKHLREMWPVIENKEGKIIYIPRYRKDFKDNHKTKFLIKLK